MPRPLPHLPDPLVLAPVLVLALLVLAGLPAAAQVSLEKPFHASRPASPHGTVTIYNRAGTILVRGWESEEVAVSGVIEDGRHTALRLEGADGDTSVTIAGEHLSFMQRVFTGQAPKPAQLEVRVPRGSRVVVDGVLADVRVEGVAGALRLGVAHGRVEILGAPQRVAVRTVSAPVRFAGRTRDLAAGTTSGDVEVAGVERRLAVKSVSGSVQATGEGLERVTMETVSGSLAFAGSVRPPGRLDAETVSGEIELALPADLEAAYRLAAPRGRIVNLIGPPPRHQGEGMILNFGRRGALVTASTVSGRLELVAATGRTDRTAPR